MIKCDMGKVELSGPKLFVKAELATLIHTMILYNHLSKDDIEMAVHDGIANGEAERNKKEESVDKENTSEKIEEKSTDDDFDSMIALVNALFNC